MSIFKLAILKNARIKKCLYKKRAFNNGRVKKSILKCTYKICASKKNGFLKILIKKLA